MGLSRKIDRAFQWAGEKVGGEKTAHSDEFKNLETEMNLRHEGMEKLQKSTNGYVKWISRRGEAPEDKEKAVPIGFVGRMMATHGEDFEPDSEFGNGLIAVGRANERIAETQEAYAAEVNQNWLEAIERSLAMMKEYQGARKKHESRRLAYDASISKMNKAKRDDYRIEEEMRSNRAKFEESGEDVMRRMQDIKEAEADNIRDLSNFLDAELEYHERCAEELRRVRQAWAANVSQTSPNRLDRISSIERRPTGRSRANTARSFNDYAPRNQIYEEQEPEPEAQPVRMPFRSIRSEQRFASTPEPPARPSFARSQTFQGPASERRASAIPSMPSISALRGSARPTTRTNTNSPYAREDVFADDYDESTASGSGSPDWGARSASPATSMGSLTRSTSNLGIKKAPPPPPPCRSKKPAPPIPPKRASEVGY
ncbi:BAR domain-containing protein [Verticillium alfalfae VaMs.102]|uniref:BAR domain-containing protein n=1 Tax=Verticillium alfalfae (strain VaMs.102 / ATCC MYA-4576 / FGSC 10136) TaxID=526221 RepID=C9SVU9_VERA1|nr:BAR domain-containing protein [Verticillium alfalfae VaMs.102]EEY22914.1 BAR domain-containing protein [Verticillium alfalfae VaMs.102]